MLLEKQYKGFTRNGANLSAKDKEILRKIDGKLSKLKLKFGENLLAETNKNKLCEEITTGEEHKIQSLQTEQGERGKAIIFIKKSIQKH